MRIREYDHSKSPGKNKNHPINAQKTGKTTWFAKLRLKLNRDLASKGETMALYTIGEVALLCDINPVTLRA